MSPPFFLAPLQVCGVIGMLFAAFQYSLVAKVSIGDEKSKNSDTFRLIQGEGGSKLIEIYNAVREGADSFLFAEYRICGIFIVLFGAAVLVLTSYQKDEWNWTAGSLTCLSFVVGSCTSIVSGYLGMKVAVFSNARTTVSAMDTTSPWTASFNCAFRAGAVMGLSLIHI